MGPIDDLPPLREVIARHGLMAKKALGQNFLFDLNLTGRIARAAGPLEDVTVLEVGPGPGGLTRALLAAGALRVVAVERDPRCLPALAEIAERYPGRLSVIEGDALTIDPRAVVGPGPACIVANLPYNVATPLLTGWLTSEPWPPWFRSLTLMFQKEVAQRIVARPGEDAYGRLGVLAGWRTEARIVFDVKPSAFVPPPKVVSSVVHLVPRAEPIACQTRALERITQAAFGQRRKMIRQSLKGLGIDAGDLIAAAGLDPTSRAETLSVADFCKLAQLIEPA
jgi:16S rRNA (adenine1518-N6/adenine1519-N6)-dimethyltransferase